MKILDNPSRCHPEQPAVLEQRVVDMAVERWSGSDLLQDQDLLAVEEALEIRLVYGTADQRTRKTISVTMRTPGNDLDLATETNVLVPVRSVADKSNQPVSKSVRISLKRSQHVGQANAC